MYPTATKAYTFPLDNKVEKYVTQTKTYQISKIGKKIGNGSFGQVYEAANDKDVVKHVDKYNPMDNYVQSHDLFSITELVVLKKKMFCNIPVLKNVSSSSEKLMIEMNNCGKTLYEFSRQLTFEQRCSLLPWVAHQLITAALQLQVNGIIHNDIKSANVLINDQLVVSLIDFGLCIFETVDNNHCGLSVSRSWGTYSICPPEMFTRGEWSVDKMMPWSIGITLCEFLFSTYNFLRDDVFDAKEKKLYNAYIKYDHMMKSLLSSVFNRLIGTGEKCIFLQSKHQSQTIPDNVILLIAKLLTFNPHIRISLQDALLLPIFHEYVNAFSVCNYMVPDIYYNKIDRVLSNNSDMDVYAEYRTCCIEWIYKTYELCNKLHLFPHAVSLFDRLLSKIYISHEDYILVACAVIYVAQYINKSNALRIVYIVDKTYKIIQQFGRKKVEYTEVKLYIEMILVALDYNLYYRTFDTLLAQQQIPVSYERVYQVLVSTLPPYNNMVLVKNYKKTFEQEQ
jgi:serine/threonine protein kinase